MQDVQNDDIEWSPTTKMWLGRRWFSVRLQKFIAKEKAWSMCRYKNTKRSCRRQRLKGTNKRTLDELNTERKVCKKNLKELQQTDPYRWVFHLQQRCRIALAQGDVNKTKALLELIKNERKSKRLRRIEHVTGKTRGQSVLLVKVPILSG